jgi:hypothetical protein
MVNFAVIIIVLSSGFAGTDATQTALAERPTVITTTPAVGARISPGPFLLSATFDRPMMDGSYSFVQVSKDTYPECKGQPTRSPDGRTFTLRCTARAGRHYEVWFNRPPYLNFKSIRGAPAKPSRLKFEVLDR